MDWTTVFTIAAPTALVTLGAAYGGTKQAVRHVEHDVDRLNGDVKDMQIEDKKVSERLVRLETKLDIIIKRLGEQSSLRSP